MTSKYLIVALVLIRPKPSFSSALDWSLILWSTHFCDASSTLFQARVLFNLQYLDDAIFLTRRSLEVQPPDQNAWQQHFQLGEILKVSLELHCSVYCSIETLIWLKIC